VQIINTLME